MARLPLQRVVVHGQDFFVIVLPRNAVRDLVDVDELIDQDQKTTVTGLLEEHGEKLDVLVPVVVRDDDVDAELGPGLGFIRILAAEPLDDLRLFPVVSVEGGAVVDGQQPGEIEAVNHLVQGVDHRVYLLLHQPAEAVVAGREPALERRFALNAADPPVEDERERAALRTGPGGHILNQFLVGGEPLPPGALQPPLRGEVRVRHDEVPVHGIIANGLQEKAFAAAVPACDKAEGGAALRDQVDVVQQGVDLRLPADRDVRQPDPRHHAAFQGVDDDGRYASGYFHFRIIPLNSSL